MLRPKLDEVFESFIDKNNKFLLENYPGLSVRSLLFAYEDFCAVDKLVLGDFYFNDPLNIDQALLDDFLNKVLTGIPLNYISKKATFLDLTLYVDERVLIPRSETEILADDIARVINKNPKEDLRICDVGAGSGCLSLGILSMLKNKCELDVIDLSPEALSVAQNNFYHHQFRLDPKSIINFVECDRLSIQEKAIYDVVVTNPPYIKKIIDKDLVHTQVHKFEPEMALYLPDNEYDQWFNDFFKQILRCLKEGGFFAMECSEQHIRFLLKMAEEIGFNSLKIVSDLTGRERFLYGYKGNNSWIN